MAREESYEEGDEPITGCRLVDFLGKGQFGEVWKAVMTDSGKEVAIKIIDLSYSPGALKELRALKLMINLDHPHLVTIHNAWLKDKKANFVRLHDVDLEKQKGKLKQLMIVMSLGEKSLSARLKEINPDGTEPHDVQGIPPEELIEYMLGAARGIDYLNQPDHKRGAGDGPIIHCDIKPDNMMIVKGTVQIADCGVAVMLTEDTRRTSSAFSMAYAPPEMFTNNPGPFSDQYSLAISYYELRVGRLPFPENFGINQIFAAHSQGRLDFSSPTLTELERTVLRWGTALQPKNRFPTCLHMVKQLERALNGLPPIEPGKLTMTASTITRPRPREAIRDSNFDAPGLPTTRPGPSSPSDADSRGTLQPGTHPPDPASRPNSSSQSSDFNPLTATTDSSFDSNWKPTERGSPTDSRVTTYHNESRDEGQDLPVDPNDPLGDSHPRAVLDRELLGLAEEVHFKTLPKEPAMPVPLEPVPVPLVDPRQPEPAPRSDVGSQTMLPSTQTPAWYKEAQNAERDDVRQAQSAGAWNEVAKPKASNNSTGIIAGIVIVLLLSAGGIFVLTRDAGNIEIVNKSGGDSGTPIPPPPPVTPTKDGDGKKGKDDTGKNTTTNPGKTEVKPVGPDTKQQFRELLRGIPNTTAATVEVELKEAFKTWPEATERKEILAVLVKSGSGTNKDLQQAIARSIAKPEMITLLDDTAKKQVFEWFFEGQTAEPKTAVEKAFVMPTAADGSLDTPANRQAVTKLNETIGNVKQLFGSTDGLRDEASTKVVRLAEVADIWRGAVEQPRDDKAMQKLRDTITADPPPPMAAPLAFEYMRIGQELPLKQLKAVRDHVQKWPSEVAAKEQIELVDQHYQVSLGRTVSKQLGQEKPNWTAILAECGTDRANGWALVAEAEDKLNTATGEDAAVSRLLRTTLEGKFTADDERKKFANYLNACNRSQAKDLVPLFTPEPTGLLATTSRKLRAANVLFTEAKKAQRKNSNPLADFAKNPYPASGEQAAWLQLADTLMGRTNAELALHVYLAKPNPELLSRIKIADVNSLSTDELDAALAFFRIKGDTATTDDAKRLAFDQAAQCGLRVMEQYRKTKLTTDADEKEFNSKYAALMREQLITPVLQMQQASTNNAARLAEQRVRFVNDEFELFQYFPNRPTAEELADKFLKLSEELPASAPLKMEAMAAYSFASMTRFFPLGSNGLSTDEAKKKWAPVWEKMVVAAETAANSPSSPYLAHLTLATVGAIEFGAITSVPTLIPYRSYADELDRAKLVAEQFKIACEKMGGRKNPNMWDARSKHLIYLARAIAKLGGDTAQVKDYLTEALTYSETSAKQRQKERYMDAYQRGMVLEDLALLCRNDPKGNYARAITLFTPKPDQDMNNFTTQLSQLEIARCAYRGVHFNALDRAELDKARTTLQKLLKNDNIDAQNIIPAKRLLAAIERENQNVAEAEKILTDVTTEAMNKNNAEESVFILGERAKLALDQLQAGANAETWRPILKECSAKLTEAKATATSSDSRFLGDYYTGMHALAANDNKAATEALTAAAKTIAKLKADKKLVVDEPYALECLESVMLTEALPIEVRKSARELLQQLRKQHSWVLTKKEADRIDTNLKN